MAATFPSPFVHDLVLLHSCEVETDTDGTSDNDGMENALKQCPWAVIRRNFAPASKIPIGIRGAERRLRWGGFVGRSQIAKVVAPMHLRSGLIARARHGRPAMRSLCFLESELSSFSLQWGPGGSVGYELASQQPIVHAESDLDLIILAPQPFDREFAGELLALLHASPGKVDCRIETLWCGFSLEEYVRSGTEPLLVRTPTGPFLSNAPWTLAPSEDEK